MQKKDTVHPLLPWKEPSSYIQPLLLIKAQKKMETMEVGDIVIINVDHSCAIKNIPEWADQTGYACRVEEIDDGEWNIIVEKSK